jgi:hypothetical protein
MWLPLHRPKFESGIRQRALALWQPKLIEAKAVELPQSARPMVPDQEKD